MNVFVLVLIFQLKLISGTVVLQTDEFCSICTDEYCRNPPDFRTRYDFKNPVDNYEDIVSQSYNYYQDARNCIVNIKALPNHQIVISLDRLDIDSNHGPINEQGVPSSCRDYLKVFNGPRVDNARLLPGIPPSGLCGTFRSSSDFPNLRSFKTTQNELTVQFVSDNKKDNKAGFKMTISQYPYSNPGNLYPEGGNPGGWNDGSFNEFQNNWDEQIVIPGGIGPGSGNDYDKEINGISCYSCSYCNVEPFKAEDSGVGTEKGCHVCSKEWDEEYQVANRKCYTQVQYNTVLLSLSTNINSVSEYTGCKKFVTVFQRTVNYCFCKGNLCNHSNKMIMSPVLIILCFILQKFFRHYI